MNSNKKIWLYCQITYEDKVALEVQEKRLIDFAEKNDYTIEGVSKDIGFGMTMEYLGSKEVEHTNTAQSIGAVLEINRIRIARNMIELLAGARKVLLTKCIADNRNEWKHRKIVCSHVYGTGMGKNLN